MHTIKLLRLSVASILVLCVLPALGGALSSALAQGGSTLGPETITLNRKKTTITRTFSVSDPSAPYTVTLTNGNGNSSLRVKKGTFTLNGETLLDNDLINKRFGRVVRAIHPRQQNEITLAIKGAVGSQITISVEPTTSTLLNDPSSQQDIAFPFCVTVDQSNHRAYVSDRHLDSVIEFDIQQAAVTRRFTGLDGDQTPGNGATGGVSFNPSARTVVAMNQGEPASAGATVPAGSITVVNLNSGNQSTTSLTDSAGDIHPVYVAVNPNSNVAAFNAQYSTHARRAFFYDLASGSLSSRSENIALSGVASNSFTNEFIFAASEQNASPALIVYSALSPFQRIKRIDSTAPSGTSFEKVAINPATNIAVAVNQRNAAVFLFDIAAGRQISRIPIVVGTVGEPVADVAINPERNIAVVTSRYTNLVSVIDLTTGLVMAEIPLPAGVRPIGVGVDNQLNRAVISENGLSSGSRNGSILVIQLPNP
jgi:hypothetical protein